jgi:AbrB family looped-hinge helix DNA binding protein
MVTMWTLTIKSRGRIPLPKDVVEHLGVGPGDEIEFELLPGGRGALMRAKPSKKINDSLGLLASQTKEAVTIDDINKAAQKGKAGKK